MDEQPAVQERTVWRKAGIGWRALAVLGLCGAVLIPPEFPALHLRMPREPVPVPSDTYVLAALIVIALMCMCWLSMIRSGGIAAWLWSVPWTWLGLRLVRLSIWDPWLLELTLLPVAFCALQVWVSYAAWKLDREKDLNGGQ